MGTACRRHNKRPGLSVFKMDKLCLRQIKEDRQNAVASQANRAMFQSGLPPSFNMAGPVCASRRVNSVSKAYLRGRMSALMHQ